jgi:hypothetical protein
MLMLGVLLAGPVVAKDDGLHKHLHELLLQHFGYTSFRGQQLQAIETVLQGIFLKSYVLASWLWGQYYWCRFVT